jgi:hypothetical protein
MGFSIARKVKQDYIWSHQKEKVVLMWVMLLYNEFTQNKAGIVP